MSILSDFEDRMGRAVEGMFAGVFRSPVQPAELARALAKEMDRRRVVGIGKVYAPTLYNVLLSPEDDTQLGGFADTLAGELETYLVGYARERSLSLAVRPVVRFLVDHELKLGRFEVIGELLSPDELAQELGDDVSAKPSPVPVIRAGLLFDAESEDADDVGLPAPGIATVTVRDVDHDVVLRGERMIVGRISTADICLADANTSRQHAAFIHEADGWAIEDLGSTNGTLVNGVAIDRQPLSDGDLIVIGVTELIYHKPRS